jgi:hypothetical protein
MWGFPMGYCLVGFSGETYFTYWQLTCKVFHQLVEEIDVFFWEYLLHVSTFATTRVALPTGVEPG